MEYDDIRGDQSGEEEGCSHPKEGGRGCEYRCGSEGQIKAEGDRIVIEPIRDAIWLALHGKKIGKILPEELEEENMNEQIEL